MKEARLNISLMALQDALKDSVPPEECEKYYNLWEDLRVNGESLIGKLEAHITGLPNELSKAFPSIIGATEEWFQEGFNKDSNPHHKQISPIIVALYDLLLSLKRSYEHKSAMSCGMITRSIFEARVTLAEISRDPVVFVPQFAKYKEVARYWNEFRNEKMDQAELVLKLKDYTEWHDENWKIMKKKGECWTGIASDNAREIAKRNDLETEYKYLYKITSAFVHISPLLSNYYSVQGNGPICNERGVFDMTFIGLSQYIECYVLALKIIGLDGSLPYGALHIPLTLFSKS